MSLTAVRVAAALAGAAIVLTACGSEPPSAGPNPSAPETAPSTEQAKAADKQADRKRAAEKKSEQEKAATATQPRVDPGGQ